MRFIRLQSAVVALSLVALAGFVANTAAPIAQAQSNISGDIVGTVTDASGAALPNATVTVTSKDKGQVKTVTSDGVGNYRVPLLAPGRYEVSVTASGFDTTTQEASISAGVITPLSVKLTVGQAATTVEVSGGTIELLHVDDAQISTTFDLQQIENLPNPGNDLTFVAQTAPGAVMNTQGGYGNFSTNGLPATSNTFTVNGGYEGDPYLNLNNSGATNLLLGNNDVDTVTVTTNSYDAAFGGLGGAQVNEISRSGGNKYHGNVAYWWNGRLLNANSFFNKYYGDPRNFDNANQWAAAIGGPLKKDKIFGFIDTEGIRVIIPERGVVAAPSPGYQAAILGAAGTAPAKYAPYGNLADNGLASEAPLYKSLFSYYNNAKNFGTGQLDPLGDPDVWIFNGQTTNFGREWLVNDRVDFNLGSNDHLYVHSKADHGVQPTATSFLTTDFDAQSPQPSYEGQIAETHTFTPALTNQFLFAASYYRAIFTNTSAVKLAATVPFVLIPEGYAAGGDWDIYGGQPNWIGNIDYALPQGRNVTGYQFTDDLNWTRGKNTWKTGFTMRRDDITDYTSSEHDINFAGAENIIYDQGDFAAGYGDVWVERFPRRLSEPVALYVMGGYLQDQYKPVSNLTITAGLRIEHNSNPLCRGGCVSNFSQDFNSLPTGTSTAYNSLITSGLHQAFFEQQNVALEPRVGFSLLPGGPGSKTTVRGGFGMFADYFPAQIMGDLLANTPNVDRFTVLGAAYGNLTPLDSGMSTSGHAIASTSNAALQSLFPKGGCYKGCGNLSLYDATGGVFARPTITSVAHKVYLPTYEEWSFAIEHQVAKNTVISATYVGNHTYHQPVSRLPNAFDGAAPGTPGSNASVPTSRPNAALGSVTEYYSGNSSNYNGLIVTATSRVHWLTLQANYAYGHALDESSNGGFDAFGVNGNGQINPNDLTQNYGNADYDTRHYISANYAINVPHFAGPRVLVDNWEIAGDIFHNSGYPFSVTDNNGAITYGTAALARQIDNNFNHHCGGKSHVSSPCDYASHFSYSTDFGQQRRNQLYGPNYTDFDVDLAKGFKIPKSETAKLTVGAQFFNIFNHANFQIPQADVNDGPGTSCFAGSTYVSSSCSNGIINAVANTPTSILGAFLGGDASPRLIQAKVTLVF